MKKVTGLGGLFFKTKNPKEMNEWYNKHLGLNAGKNGAIFKFRDFDNPNDEKYNVWSTFNHDTEYFNPSKKEFMINFAVDNLDILVETLKEQGIEIIGGIEEYEYGKFAWILDPDGTKIELWEPPNKLK